MLYFRYHSTNCYFVPSSRSDKLLAVDAGWPNTLHEYSKALKQLGYQLNQIAWSIVTHFHMDHAGLLSEFLDRGVICFVFEKQEKAIDQMERTIWKSNRKYKSITKEKLARVRIEESRRLFEKMGIDGEVIATDYHSDDSISFITDNHEAIVGDLPPITQVMPDDMKCVDNWQILKRKGIETIYPSHAAPFLMNVE